MFSSTSAARRKFWISVWRNSWWTGAQRPYQSASEQRADWKRLQRQIDPGQVNPAGPVWTPRRRRWAYAASAAMVLAGAAASILWLQSGGKPAARSEWAQLTNFPDSVV